MSLTALAALGWVIAHLGAAGLVVVVAWLVGSRLTAVVPWRGGGERALAATTVGIAALGQLLFLLGLLGWLRPLPVGLLLVAAPALALATGAHPWRRPRTATLPTARAALTAVGVALAVGPLVLLPLYPPIDFDATMYHLPFARAFAESGALPALPDLRFPVFPQLNEVLFAAALLLADDVLAQQLQAIAGLLTGGLLLFWDRRGDNGLARWAPGAIAAAIWLGTPMVVQLGGAAYVDLATTLFFTLTAGALARWCAGGERPWLTLAAFAAGAAAASKYTGLFAVAAVVLLALWDGRERRFAAAGWAATVALLTAGPWYLRIYLETGNPVHPLFSQLFGGEPMPLFGSAGAMLAARGGIGEALRSWLVLPWSLVAAPAAIGWTWSKLYLLGLPLAVWTALREPFGRRVGLAMLLYSLVFALLSFPDHRLLLPIAPLWCWLIGRGCGRLLALLPRRVAPVASPVAIAIAALALYPGASKGWRELHLRGLPPDRPAEREAFLQARLPAYPALAYLNRERGSDASVYAFFAENLTYFAAGRYQGDWFGPAGYHHLFPLLGDAEALADRLQAFGADHLLLAANGPYPRPPLAEGDPAVARRFVPLFADSGARLYRILGRVPAEEQAAPGTVRPAAAGAPAAPPAPG